MMNPLQRAHPVCPRHLNIGSSPSDEFAGIGHRITGVRRHRNRGIGWDFVHVCLDDFTPLVYVEVLEDEQGRAGSFDAPRTNGKAERFIQTLPRGWAFCSPVHQLGSPAGRARIRSH
jgi:hypothetical protein